MTTLTAPNLRPSPIEIPSIKREGLLDAITSKIARIVHVIFHGALWFITAPFKGVLFLGKTASSAVYAVFDRLFPKNSLSGTRQYCLIPRRLQKAVGGYGYRGRIHEEGGKWNHPKYQQMVKNILQKMLSFADNKDLVGKIKIVDNSEINAYALPGGFFVFYRGLIEKIVNKHKDFGDDLLKGWDVTQGKSIEEQEKITESKIAAVVGHELVHAALEHSAKSVQFYWLIHVVLAPIFWIFGAFESYVKHFLSQKFSRSHELEADKLSMELLHKIGLDPKAMIWTQYRLKDYEPSYGISLLDMIDRLFWSHPTGDERIQAAKIKLREITLREKKEIY